MTHQPRATVLTIDDEKIIRESFRFFLEDLNYTVLEAEDGLAGIAQFERNRPDLVLVDLRMPKADGLEVLAHIKAVSPETPIIVVSGTGTIGHAVEALRLGAWDYLLKPVENLNVLQHAVEKCLERASLIRENKAYQAQLEAEVANRTQELEKANHELKMINARLRRIVETTRDLSFCSQVTEFGTQLLEEFSQHMLADGGSLYLLEEKGLRRVHAIDPGHAPDFIPFPLREGSVLERIMDLNEPVLISDFNEWPEINTSGWEGYQDSSILVFPLQNEQGTLVGVLSLHSKTPPPFTAQDKEIGSILASYSCEALRATRAAESLRESEERLQLILNSLQIGIVIIDAANFKIVDVNPAAANIIGTSKEKIVGQTCYNYLCPAQKGACPIIDGDREIDQSERLLITADGKSIPIIKTVTPINLNGRKHLLESFVDIREREKAEGERIRLTTAIEQAAETFIITDLEGTIEYVNPAFELLSGHARTEVIGQKAHNLIGPEGERVFSEGRREAALNGRVWKGRLTYTKKVGAPGVAEVTISPVRDGSGVIVNVVLIMRDMTHEDQLESKLRQAQKMESIGTLAGGIAHDFNNILAAIMGYSQMAILDVAKNGQVFGNLQKVLAASERAKDLIGQILSFSRQTDQKRKIVKISDIVDETLKLLRASLPSTIEIRHRLERQADIVSADPTQIHQVLMNLCTNAHHAMRSTGGVLELDVAPVELGPAAITALADLTPGPYVKLTIQDSGQGMDSETVEHIFDPYFTTKEKGEGTGLGLAVVHGIVKSHQGTIAVESRPGHGSAFHVYLPSVGETKTEAAADEIITMMGGHEHVLYVDDEEALIDVGRSMLTYLGYTVDTDTDGLQALERFQRHPERFDLVVTDMTMPKMTGDKLAQELLKIRPTLPIVICTGYSETVASENVLAQDIKGFLTKPFSLNKLAQTLRQALDKA